MTDDGLSLARGGRHSPLARIWFRGRPRAMWPQLTPLPPFCMTPMPAGAAAPTRRSGSILHYFHKLDQRDR